MGMERGSREGRRDVLYELGMSTIEVLMNLKMTSLEQLYSYLLVPEHIK